LSGWSWIPWTSDPFSTAIITLAINYGMKPALFLPLSASVAAAAAATALYPHDPSLPWTYEGDVVGELPSSCNAESADFCVSRCLERDVKLTSCCESGRWKVNSDVTICDDKCDQVDGFDLDHATCELELFGYADTDRLSDVPAEAASVVQNFAMPPATSMPDDLRVVFLGDGNGRTSVYSAAAAFNPDFVVFNADMDYGTSSGNPESWMDRFDDYFGRDMPMFTTIGNHDSCMWFENSTIARGAAWETVLEARYRRLGLDSYCSDLSKIGIMNTCHYKGLLLVEAGIGELSGRDSTTYNNFISQSLASHVDSPWKLVNWHKNQRLMQLGSKSDSIGWNAYVPFLSPFLCSFVVPSFLCSFDPSFLTTLFLPFPSSLPPFLPSRYEEARKYGAMINNAHEHSYSRSYTMRSLASNSSLLVDNYDNDVTLDFGKTFVFTNGLSGASIRNADSSLAANPWWASWAAGNGNKGVYGDPRQSTSYGYMACTFSPNGVKERADCFFEDVNGRRFDEFSIRTRITPGSGPQPQPNERACRREYDLEESGYSPQRFAKCGVSGTCCRSKPGSNNCYYTTEDPSNCDDLPATCTTSAPYRDANDVLGGSTRDSPECSRCLDSSSFRDENNYMCDDWKGYDCANYKEGDAAYLTPEGRLELQQNCRVTCGHTADDSSYRDENGYRCSDWVGYDCSRDDQMSNIGRQELNTYCPQTCGHC
jgi:hypothetical protein